MSLFWAVILLPIVLLALDLATAPKYPVEIVRAKLAARLKDSRRAA